MPNINPKMIEALFQYWNGKKWNPMPEEINPLPDADFINMEGYKPTYGASGWSGTSGTVGQIGCSGMVGTILPKEIFEASSKEPIPVYEEPEPNGRRIECIKVAMIPIHIRRPVIGSTDRRYLSY